MKKHTGSCHCGKVQFEVEADVSDAISCNCSICHRKGTVLAFVPASSFKLISGESDLTDYQFNKKMIHHTFCSICGVTAFASGQMPDGTLMKAINLRCIDDLDLSQINIKPVDGKSF